MHRFETLDPDEFFYPEVSYRVDRENALQKKDVVWAATTSDPRALQKNDGSKDRIAAAWQTTLQSFAIDLTLPKDQPHQVALYLLDWSPVARRGAFVELIDQTTGKSVARQFVNKFDSGKYVVYQAAGDVRIKVTATSSAMARPSAASSSTPAKRPSSRSKALMNKFIRIDEETSGNWKGVYGSEGHQIVGGDSKLPPYAYDGVSGRREQDRVALARRRKEIFLSQGPAITGRLLPAPRQRADRLQCPAARGKAVVSLPARHDTGFHHLCRHRL